MAGLLLAGPAVAAPSEPAVVSIDYCADQYVLALADRAQIHGVSPRARQAFSYHRDRAAGVPVIEPVSEAVLFAAPDLVVRFWGGNQRLVSMLDRTGVDTVNIVYGHDSETIFANLTKVAAALGRTEEAARLIADQRDRMAALEAKPRLGLRALYLTPSGTTGGTGTDIDGMIRLAGLENMAAELGYRGWRTLSLEELVMNPPDVFIGSFFDDRDVARSSWSPARHPRLAAMMGEVRTVPVPGRFLSCSGLFSVDAAEYIRATLDGTR
ncbi:ABC transporter substrate-binding protein [Thalassobaculum sp. OXR-137]|uniref:ABC transporter substrate-binding protein n=1 Tax=Thalassobaculum sp. OXR-137 TaxID=3100173 RepID=UPI002AC8DC1A|nr:ABC transporter substrate-binding protein [Thalassobaculum sp. OXR-137]WPZ33540.1 ABC transporter substrate-binding protein [Thalassobaculum sp. OXR-137]